MPRLFIHMRNAQFTSRDNGAEYDCPEAALSAGVRAATAIAADEIQEGRNSVAVEIRIEKKDRTPLLCSVISLSVSALLTDHAMSQGGSERVPVSS